ncbi:hypothetical protein GEMRC1_009420 [Eukaryota sp. GEM-RC1]
MVTTAVQISCHSSKDSHVHDHDTHLFIPISLYYIYRRSVTCFSTAYDNRTRLRIVSGVVCVLIFFLTFFPRFLSLEPSIFSRVVYLIGDIFFGVVFATLFGLSVGHFISFLYFHYADPPDPKYPLTSWWLGVFISFFILLIGFLVSTNVQITHYSVDFDLSHPVRLGVVGDVHLNGVQYRNQILHKIKNFSLEYDVDYLLLLGDIIDVRNPSEVFKATSIDLSIINHESTNSTVIGILGNHDRMSDSDEVSELLQSAEITVLKNEEFPISEQIQFFGIDDFPSDSDSSLEQLNSYLEHNATSSTELLIVLNHQPHDSIIDRLKRQQSSINYLFLAAHTHKGQAWPFTFFVPLFFSHFYGHYSHSDSFSTIVTSGVGTWGPPVRIGSRSEYVVIDIK